jgi:two-component system OmpR family sensor kinase
VKTIKHQLLVWLLGGMLASIMLVGIALYLQVREEANELFDNQLQQVAQSFPGELAAQPTASGDEAITEDILVQVWDRDGVLVYVSRTQVALPRSAQDGFMTTVARGEQWRVYAITSHKRFVQVAQPLAVRQEVITGLALRSLLPFLFLIPALAVLVSIVVERGLRPLQMLTAAIQQRSHQSLDPLLLQGMSAETQPMLDALNELLGRLERAMALQRDFVADAAHELRTPLTALKLQLQLAERAKSAEERTAAFEKVDERLDRSIRLVQQLLTLVRGESQSEPMALAPVDLLRLAQQAVSDHLALAGSKHIDLGVEPCNSRLDVMGDADELRVMLGNLVDNAVRYTLPAGRVDVCVCVCEGLPALQVVDNGPGIPAEERQRVLDRFYRCAGTTETGSGLGLAIAASLAKRHGATLRLSDNPAGNGLTVTVAFPPCAASIAQVSISKVDISSKE